MSRARTAHDLSGTALQRLLAAPRYLPTTVGWAVRRTWKPCRDHEFVCWRATQAKAIRAAAADRAYWSGGPVRPVHHLVQMSLAEFRATRSGGGVPVPTARWRSRSRRPAGDRGRLL